MTYCLIVLFKLHWLAANRYYWVSPNPDKPTEKSFVSCHRIRLKLYISKFCRIIIDCIPRYDKNGLKWNIGTLSPYKMSPYPTVPSSCKWLDLKNLVDRTTWPWRWSRGHRLACLPSDPSSNPAEDYSFYVKFVFEKNENKQKDDGVGPFKKSFW